MVPLDYPGDLLSAILVPDAEDANQEGDLGRHVIGREEKPDLLRAKRGMPRDKAAVWQLKPQTHLRFGWWLHAQQSGLELHTGAGN